MKKTKIVCLIMAATLLTSSCSSSYQESGTLTGAMIGGEIGEAVGFLSGHDHSRGRSAAVGRLVGMGVGAVLGYGITSQVEANERVTPKRDKHRDYDKDYYSQGYQTGGGAGMSNIHLLKLSDISFAGMTSDGYISKNEIVEVEGYITNMSNKTFEDIVIFINVNDAKHFTVSPSFTTTLQPGQRIRYTGRVLCRKARHGQSAVISLNAKYGNQISSSENLMLRMR